MFKHNLIFCIIIVSLVNGCQKPALPPLPDPPIRPLQAGIEYAVPGMGETLYTAGFDAVKFLPEQFSWDKMQSSSGAKIDYSKLDRLVLEYQNAGISQIVIGLVFYNKWASIDSRLFGQGNYTPKPEYHDAFQQWVRGIVERYNFDGTDDMPGLRAPIIHYEVGVEFSSYTPGPVEDYLLTLELAYKAAHDAFADVVIAHSAFLPVMAFKDKPTPDEYEAAFAAMPERIFNHGLAGMRTVLDHPEFFDVVNFHALGTPYEITEIVKWLRWEIAQRGYDKPLICADTLPNPLIAYGNATVCGLPENQMGLVFPPVTEADRCRVASEFFTPLADATHEQHQEILEWNWGFVARDNAKKIILSGASDVAIINASFVEDLIFSQYQAGAGTSAWAGIAEVSINPLNDTRTVTDLRPMHYAMQQLLGFLEGYDNIIRMDTGDEAMYLFAISDSSGKEKTFWIAWYEEDTLLLLGDPVPQKELLYNFGGNVVVEKMIDAYGQTEAEQTAHTSGADCIPLGIQLDFTPVFIFSQN